MEIDIKRLTPALSEDFLRFFDHAAFCDNPDWADCYCCFYYFKDEWHQRTGEENRCYAAEAIKSGAMNGYLAYIGDEVVGWINADDKNAYARLEATEKDENVLCIVCFTISPKHRRQGIATKLLSAAIDGAKQDGFDYIEAYPAKDADTDAHNYHGPIELYKRMGFETVSEDESFWVVRKSL